jgi:hypothetical protein
VAESVDAQSDCRPSHSEQTPAQLYIKMILRATLIAGDVCPETHGIMTEAISHSTGRASTAALPSAPTPLGGLQIIAHTRLPPPVAGDIKPAPTP